MRIENNCLTMRDESHIGSKSWFNKTKLHSQRHFHLTNSGDVLIINDICKMENICIRTYLFKNNFFIFIEKNVTNIFYFADSSLIMHRSHLASID
ncbi:hypothetical protein BpHYR1_003565 [Brachionus plicatilis]|uniref:Uncharacterized protein n=1 Tax=Brachionus plicatilis TaxID=10195 RepID=A0A3M7QEE0_BRAPC|nr:hypothetical protein BpHYR1_003565 [Brachionus plicatilis]